MSSPRTPTGGRIKGAPLRALVAYWERVHGRAAVNRILDASEAERVALGLDPEAPGWGLLVSSWYPCPAAGAMVERLFEGIAADRVDDEMARAAEAIMRQTLSGVHRAVFRLVGSPELMRTRGQLFWNQQFDSGTVVIEKEGDDAQRHVYRDWPGHHPLFCRMAFHCLPPMFRAMGVADPRVERLRCAADPGSSECAAHLTWSG
ncbi:MAG TPA: hypothetical protein RMH99_23645 [Sandaracinaceae bacterium LLY-WYZ-13_1]|nr:hypothetical protein [Sandaracinaceae bacterium LLY-WYZ-13_1]